MTIKQSSGGNSTDALVGPTKKENISYCKQRQYCMNGNAYNIAHTIAKCTRQKKKIVSCE